MKRNLLTDKQRRASKMKYDILYGYSIESLMKQVNTRLDADTGWKPAGGVYVQMHDGHNAVYYQAVYREN